MGFFTNLSDRRKDKVNTGFAELILLIAPFFVIVAPYCLTHRVVQKAIVYLIINKGCRIQTSFSNLQGYRMQLRDLYVLHFPHI